jgi:hypothetical protein
MTEEGALLVMEEARRQLDRQEADLDTLRGKVATALTGAAIVAAVFGASLTGDRSRLSTGFFIAAVTVFATSVGVAIYILWPRTWHAADARFEFDSGANVTEIEHDSRGRGLLRQCHVGGVSIPHVKLFTHGALHCGKDIHPICGCCEPHRRRQTHSVHGIACVALNATSDPKTYQTSAAALKCIRLRGTRRLEKARRDNRLRHMRLQSHYGLRRVPLIKTHSHPPPSSLGDHRRQSHAAEVEEFVLC